MGSEHALNPTGEVLFKNGMEETASSFIARRRPDNFRETPCAGPYAGSGGGWGGGGPPAHSRLPGWDFLYLFSWLRSK